MSQIILLYREQSPEANSSYDSSKQKWYDNSRTRQRFAIHSMLATSLLLSPLSAVAACFQELATYKDTAANGELAFTPRKQGEVDSMLARFTIRFPENNVVLDGIVMDAGEPFFRPLGMIMHNCPEGDATGDEIAACTVWQGIVYGLDEVGNVNYLAATNEKKEAAKTLLFPDLGAAVQMSSVFGTGKLTAPPKDDFKQSACLE